MKSIVCLLMVWTPLWVFSQTELEKEIATIEQRLEKNSMHGVEKFTIDLDEDGDTDYLYLYQCAEPNCIEVYLTVHGRLQQVINEFCNVYALYNDLSSKTLQVSQRHCCGESPFVSHRSFTFDTDRLMLVENYVVCEESNELTYPKLFLEQAYRVNILNDHYNLRFSPNIKTYREADSFFACEPHTNIIGKLKQGSVVKVLAELEKPGRKWLFVEVKNQHLQPGTCANPIDYGFEGQQLRAWISGNFVEKITKP